MTAEHHNFSHEYLFLKYLFKCNACIRTETKDMCVCVHVFVFVWIQAYIWSLNFKQIYFSKNNTKYKYINKKCMMLWMMEWRKRCEFFSVFLYALLFCYFILASHSIFRLYVLPSVFEKVSYHAEGGGEAVAKGSFFSRPKKKEKMNIK